MFALWSVDDKVSSPIPSGVYGFPYTVRLQGEIGYIRFFKYLNNCNTVHSMSSPSDELDLHFQLPYKFKPLKTVYI